MEKKQCVSAFWNGELESEVRELGNLDFFGLMKKNDDREKVMVRKLFLFLFVVQLTKFK